jgi:uncharacterized protein (DUF2384 family)
LICCQTSQINRCSRVRCERHRTCYKPAIITPIESNREDLSQLEFKAIEYKRKGNAVADNEQLARIAKVPKREFIRRGINQHTLEKICRKEAVRVSKLAKVLKALQQWKSE